MTQIAVNYAQALYDLAAEENLAAQILQELKTLAEGFGAEPDFLRLLAFPNISKQERCAIIDECLHAKVHPYVINFLKILAEKGYARHFYDCCKHFEDCYNTANGILPVVAMTAVPMTADQQTALTEKLQKLTGKTVALQNKVDPATLGGVRLCYDGKQVDGTVQNRLNRISDLLKNTVL